MNRPATRDEARLRVATRADIPLLARHHRMMFDEIRETTGLSLDSSEQAALEKEYSEKLSGEIPEGTCVAWVVGDGATVFASGAVSIVRYVPVPHDLQCRVAFLHSIYTEKEYRHRNHARSITKEAARFCRERGIRRLYLFASDAGRPLYESAGFTKVPNMMLLLQ